MPEPDSIQPTVDTNGAADVAAPGSTSPELRADSGSPATDPATSPEQCPARLPADQIGRYRVLSEIGRGGMGIVFRGRDLALNRTLAIKVLIDKYRGHADVERRFLEEVQITAQLQHPGVPPVHEVGRLEDGRPFFAMKLVKGRTLAELLKERRDLAEDLPRFLAVCQTLAYAHSRGILHRDLKPGNVMVGAFGEVQVMDWGLAKVLRRGVAAGEDALPTPSGDGAGLSQAGQVLGTPAYMAPEQARGEVDRLDERCDVFGLGAILCVILTGRPPHGSATADEALRRAARGDLAEAFAGLEACGADAELVRLARACLAPEAGARPRDAGVVAEAVAAYQAAVRERLRVAEVAEAEARATAAGERRRRRLTVSLAATVLLAVSGAAAAGLWWQHDRARRAAEQAQLERDVEADLIELASWQDRGEWPRAFEAAERAAGRLGPAAPESLRQRVEEARQELKRRYDRVVTDQAMEATLEDLRVPRQVDRDDVRAERQRVEDAFRKAFASYGVDLDRLSTEEAARRIEQSAIRDALVAALDHRAWIVMDLQAGDPSRLLEIARRADRSDWRRGLRAAIRAGDRDELKRLARLSELDEQPPATLVLLGQGLILLRAEREGVAVLRAGQLRHPHDLWLNITLASAKVEPAEAVGLWRAALAVRPTHPFLHHGLARALADQGQPAQAEQVYRAYLRRFPDSELSHFGLGTFLSSQGRLAEAEKSLRKAVELQSYDFVAWFNLGNALLKQDKPAAAEAAYRAALRVQPRYAEAHCNLGTALRKQGKRKEGEAAHREALRHNPVLAMAHNQLGTDLWDRGARSEALKEFRTAVRLDPQLREAQQNLGAALVDTGAYKEAEPVCREAVRLNPDNGQVRGNLANALKGLGKTTEAEAVYREALRIDPKSPFPAYNLGNLLVEQGKLEEGEKFLREAIRRDNDYPEAHCNLGLLLYRLGRFREGVGHVRRGHELGTRRPHWPYPSAEWLEHGERMARAEARLPAILKGEPPPREGGELVALASLCQYHAKRFAAAVRFYAAAFDARPALAEDVKAEHRYNAACVAALAAAGRGEDTAGLDDKERARLRACALNWLRADLAVYTRLAEKGKDDQQLVQRHLAHWQQDTDLDAVRDAKALAALPEKERMAWQHLWADVAALRKKVENKK
jgi:eukaryotic-like serine/threonine-protein kinase